MQIAIRADSGLMVGGGHVMRCLSLADAAQKRGHEITFLTSDTDGNLIQNISDAGHGVLVLPRSNASLGHSVETWKPMDTAQDVASCMELLKSKRPDWIILDHYGHGNGWIKALNQHEAAPPVLIFGDLDAERYDASIVLDPAHIEPTPRLFDHPYLLSGPRFAPLRPEFEQWRERALKERQNPGSRVLVTPGFMDAQNLAPVALDAMDAFPDYSVEVVMSAKSQSYEKVKAQVAQNSNWSLFTDVTDMAKRMATADYCIGAGGGTMWERCCLGLPSLTIAVSENQVASLRVLEGFDASGTLDGSSGVDAASIRARFEHLVQNRQMYSANSSALCDGLGAHRVIEYVENYATT
jgi:UDP-2,4-diacetamido-2,4,6-trideoxy-beta-L-altropyranose hydrolase